MKNALICGAGGFIGSHMVKRLKKEDFRVRGSETNTGVKKQNGKNL